MDPWLMMIEQVSLAPEVLKRIAHSLAKIPSSVMMKATVHYALIDSGNASTELQPADRFGYKLSRVRSFNVESDVSCMHVYDILRFAAFLHLWLCAVSGAESVIITTHHKKICPCHLLPKIRTHRKSSVILCNEK
jgi:hypothetical protein